MQGMAQRGTAKLHFPLWWKDFRIALCFFWSFALKSGESNGPSPTQLHLQVPHQIYLQHLWMLLVPVRQSYLHYFTLFWESRAVRLTISQPWTEARCNEPFPLEATPFNNLHQTEQISSCRTITQCTLSQRQYVTNDYQATTPIPCSYTWARRAKEHSSEHLFWTKSLI